MTMVTPEIQSQIEEILQRNADALDSADMRGWLDTFVTTPDASYICTTAENARRGLPLSLILDDCRDRLEDRVTFVTKVWAGTYQPYLTRHFLQRLNCAVSDGNTYDVRTNFMIVQTPSDTERSEIYAAGVYRDKIVIGNDGARLKQRMAIMDAAVLPRYMVFPL